MTHSSTKLATPIEHRSIMTSRQESSKRLRSFVIAIAPVCIFSFCILILGRGRPLPQICLRTPSHTIFWLTVGIGLVASVSFSCLVWAMNLLLKIQIKQLSCAVYRLSFHPLAKYPGPWSGAMTDWYTVYHCIVGDRHIDFYQLHCKYGSVYFPRKNLSLILSHNLLNRGVQDLSSVSAQTASRSTRTLLLAPFTVSTPIRKSLRCIALSDTSSRYPPRWLRLTKRTMRSRDVSRHKHLIRDLSRAWKKLSWKTYVSYATPFMKVMMTGKNGAHPKTWPT